jgi:hypothetical protein
MRTKLGWTLAALLVAVIPLFGCAARATEADEGVFAAPEAPARELAAEPESLVRASQDATIPGVTNVERKIIYDVAMDLIVEDTETAFDNVRRITQEMGGFVAESNVWRDEGHPVASMTVRVPVGRLDDALVQFRALAEDVESENMDSQDVTEEYIDLEARLKNEQRTEAELVELLETRSETGRTQDILEVHRELSGVRARIEQIQGRMKYLENLAALATIRIALTPDVLVQPVVVAGWRPQGTVRNAIRLLLRTLQALVDVLIWFLLFLLPVLIVIAIPLVIAFLIIRAIWRLIRRRREATEPAE